MRESPQPARIFSSQLLKLYIQFIDVYILYVHAQIQQGII